MTSSYNLKQKNFQKNANWVSKLFFFWLTPLFYKGIKKGLEESDLQKPFFCDESSKIGVNFEEKWKIETASLKNKSNVSLTRMLFKIFFWKYIGFGVLLFIQTVGIRCSQAVLLSYFIESFSDEIDSDHKRKIILGSVLALLGYVHALLRHNGDFGQACIGMRIKIGVSSLVYKKLLKLNQKSHGTTTNGMILNLLSNDINRIDLVVLYLNYFWIVPIQLLIISYLIWRQINISTLAGVLLMLFCTVPVQGYIARLTAKYRLTTAQKTDKRVKLINELIVGIEVIKLYAWEKAFKSLVARARKDEIKAIRLSLYLKAFYQSWSSVVEKVALFFSLTCCVLLGNSITAKIVFPLLQLFYQLQLGLAIYLPLAINYTSEVKVSIQRIESFLLLEEKIERNVESLTTNVISFKNVSTRWPNTNNLVVEKVNFDIPQGTLCAIIGPVGAGKTSLLQVLLQELPILNGHLNLSGRISYASQKPWIFGSTIRENILFGAEYNAKLFEIIIDICALKKDLDMFPQKDQTLVGERGITLSGGQKIRINLARAVYREADIYVFDDPLSAVDAHVGKHMFEKCILEYLHGKTRILVTHQLQYLNKADVILVIKNGQIEAKGTYKEITDSNIDFSKLLLKTEYEEETNIVGKKSFAVSTDITKNQLGAKITENKEDMIAPNSKPLLNYLRFGGNRCILSGIILLFVLNQIAFSGLDLWLTFWTNQNTLQSSNPETPGASANMISITSILTETVFHTKDHQIIILERNVALYIYTTFIIVVVLLTFLKTFGFYTFAIKISKNLHKKMFSRLLKVPIRFFVWNPSGRILNRFSKDLGAIDEMLPQNACFTFPVFLNFLGSLVMILISNYFMILPIFLIGLFLFKLQTWYATIGKNVQDLESIAKSPVLSHINSTFNGISTIRALQAEEIVNKEFDALEDNHTSASFLTLATRFFFALWFDITLALFLTIVIFGFIILNYYFHVHPSLVGLAVSQTLILTGLLQFGVRQGAELINRLTSVERVLHYTRLDSEISTQREEPEDKTWPNEGKMEICNLYLRYSESEGPVLHNINLVIPAKSKVGIVGRTGAGKSSLISAIFRLVPIEGSIVIDQLDTTNIPLYYLRKKISIIPQEPILFSASIRYNLDPFDEFEDRALWDVLEEVELKHFVKSLDYMISESGTNLSVGQRQLVCLARAILRKNRILILDEATANVDPKTDALIQCTIRKKFKDCTVLTIAHRLDTIMDSDKILLIDSGRMMEFDHPYILLENRDSYFSKLVEEAGQGMMTQLKNISKLSYFNNIQK